MTVIDNTRKIPSTVDYASLATGDTFKVPNPDCCIAIKIDDNQAMTVTPLYNSQWYIFTMRPHCQVIPFVSELRVIKKDEIPTYEQGSHPIHTHSQIVSPQFYEQIMNFINFSIKFCELFVNIFARNVTNATLLKCKFSMNNLPRV